MSNTSLFDLLNSLPQEVFYNARVKYRRLSDGSLEPFEIMYCNRLIFNPSGAKLSELSRKIDNMLAYREAAEELFLGKLPKSGGYVSVTSSPADNVARSLRRARGKLLDLILSNDFDCFCTLTLDGEKIARDDYSAVIKRLNVYLDNRVRRNGLIYVGVPELHKKGGIHFHFLCNSAALKLVDSGTVSCKGHAKPIKVSTADRLHVPADERRTVYNIADWSLGFTTAIMTYGSRNAVAAYVGKYLTKDFDRDKLPQKIGGRWYYSGGNLARPVCSYERVDFDSISNYTYGFECAGGAFKILKIGDGEDENHIA